MKQAKYQAGDRVLIVPKPVEPIPKSMAVYCNRIMTINTVLRALGSDAYCMVEDRGKWYWRDVDIVGRIVKKERYKAGDVVLLARNVEGGKERGGTFVVIDSVIPLNSSESVSYRFVDADLYWVGAHSGIEGCLERPVESILERDSVPDLNRGNWTEAITITTDGTHTKATLTRIGSNPVSYEVSLRRDSRDAHDLFAVAQRAVNRLRNKDCQEQALPGYTGDVFCVEAGVMSPLYTTGKIYSVQNGVLIANNGERVCDIRSFKWLQNKSLAEWMEVVK